ncbi:unnamed protein product [Heligmosomoides polygyrus]|uniref:TIL domain-containing protein n=1 Tax=Heligmosomoides polygyrus TaxID=6339 RepID=A0A3P8CH81_HELPZ|nr:unnamed protein product [Heligmosomoides polygyrus]
MIWCFFLNVALLRNSCSSNASCCFQGPIACPAVCAPAACACSDGYYRNENGKCVGSIDCSSNCKEHEQMNPCGSRCESTCDHAFGKPKFCVKICDPPACVCKLNYYRKGRECVPHAACADPNLCHQFYCPKGQECSLESGEAKCVANNDPRVRQGKWLLELHCPMDMLVMLRKACVCNIVGLQENE